MKRIMLLGGSYTQMTATKAAKELGHYVISCDYLPDNPAHKFADEYHNVSTIDKEAVLALAKTLNIDGIVSYASDVSAPTVAYVAKELGLVGNPPEAVEILTHKHLFRDFLREHGFNCPESMGFSEHQYEKALSFFQKSNKTVMVKPVDSCGSKGLTKLEVGGDFQTAFTTAITCSTSKKLVVEEYIQRVGRQREAEGFLVEGEIELYVYLNQHHDHSCTSYSPIGSSLPVKYEEEILNKAQEEVQRLFHLLGMKEGAFNFEYVVDAEEEIHIIEVGPRNGGNLIPNIIRLVTGIDFPTHVVQSALGIPLDHSSEKKPPHRNISYYAIHSLKDGRLKEVEIDKRIKDNILVYHCYKEIGDEVKRFQNSTHIIGLVLVEFNTMEEMWYQMDHMNDYIRVIVE